MTFLHRVALNWKFFFLKCLNFWEKRLRKRGYGATEMRARASVLQENARFWRAFARAEEAGASELSKLRFSKFVRSTEIMEIESLMRLTMKIADVKRGLHVVSFILLH